MIPSSVQDEPELYTLISPYSAGLKEESEDKRRTFFEKFVKLSDNLRGILVSVETADFLKNLGDQNALSTTQVSAIAKVIRAIVVGDTFIKDMPQEIASRAGIDQQTASKLTAGIIKGLFAPALEDIKHIQQQRFADRLHELAQHQQNAPPQMSTPPTSPSPSREINKNNIVDLRNQRKDPQA